jgi:hypothetical protein
MKQINRLYRNSDLLAETGTNPKYIDILAYGNCAGIKVKHTDLHPGRNKTKQAMPIMICNSENRSWQSTFRYFNE